MTGLNPVVQIAEQVASRPLAERLDRPALAKLVLAMTRLPRRQRLEVARIGRQAKAAKAPRIRRLAREAKAEAKRLAAQARG